MGVRVVENGGIHAKTCTIGLNTLREPKIIELSCEKFLKSSGSEEDAMIVF